MSDFFDSLRADLLDRRMRPLLALLGLVLLGAVAYAALSSSGSSTPEATSSASSHTSASGISITAVKPEGTQAVAETTAGTGQQTAGPTRSPFTPVSEPNAKKAAASSAVSKSSSSASSSSASGAGSSSSSSSASSGEAKSSAGTGGGAPSKPKPAPSKPQTVYHVSVLFGAAAPDTPLASAQLTPYDQLIRQQPLPSAQQPLVVFRGVLVGGKSATFTLVGEAILRGVAVCRPSASQCQTIDLQAGQTEELEYVPPGATTATTYTLHVVAIAAVKTTATGARRALSAESKTGLKLLRSIGLDALPGLSYLGAKGVLVFAKRPGFVARSQGARLRVLASAPQGLSASK